MPDSLVGKDVKERTFTRGVEYLKETYRLHGWTW